VQQFLKNEVAYKYVFELASQTVNHAIDALDDGAYYSEVCESERESAVEMLYLVLEFAQKCGIIESYDEMKMREVCRGAV